MTNSTLSPTCADDGSVNEYVHVCMYVCIVLDQQNAETILTITYISIAQDIRMPTNKMQKFLLFLLF